MVWYATDVTFEPSYRLSGALVEGKNISAKKRRYGFKVDLSVSENGIKFRSNAHEPGSVSYLKIFQAIHWFHKIMLKKIREERKFEDEGPLVDKFPSQWAIIVDTAYQRTQEFVFCV